MVIVSPRYASGVVRRLFMTHYAKAHPIEYEYCISCHCDGNNDIPRSPYTLVPLHKSRFVPRIDALASMLWPGRCSPRNTSRPFSFSLFHFYKHRECLDSISIRLPSFEIVSLKNIPLFFFSFITFKHFKRIHLILVFQFQILRNIFLEDDNSAKMNQQRKIPALSSRRFTHEVPSIVTRVK